MEPRTQRLIAACDSADQLSVGLSVGRLLRLFRLAHVQICSTGISFNVCCYGNGRQPQTEGDVKLIYCPIFSKLALFCSCLCRSDRKWRTRSTCVPVEFSVLNRQFFLLSFLSFLSQTVFVCLVLGRLSARVLSVHLSLPPSLPGSLFFLLLHLVPFCPHFTFFLPSPPHPHSSSSCCLYLPQQGERADVGVNRSRLRSVHAAQLFPPMPACAMIKTISSCHCLPVGDSGFLFM